MLCQTFPEEYDQQILTKQKVLLESLGNLPKLSIFKSEKSYYRQRAEFSIWHEEDDLNYIMFDPVFKSRVIIRDCPMVDKKIVNLMNPLLVEIRKKPILKDKLFQIDFLSTLSDEILVTLIYKKTIIDDIEWKNSANELRKTLNIDNVIGRAYKQKIALDKDYVIEKLQVDNKEFIYQQVENSFTQPNAKIAQHMSSWTRRVTQNIGDDLLELYGGNGHFSIALAEKFRQVLITEISKTSVKSAQFNIQSNNLNNVKVVRLSAQEISLALKGQEFKRLTQNNIDLSIYNFSTILVDPPRSGLDEYTCKMVKNYTYIIYISCNLETLSRDLKDILQTHEITESALFDQFPYTHHIEIGLFLKRKRA